MQTDRQAGRRSDTSKHMSANAVFWKAFRPQTTLGVEPSQPSLCPLRVPNATSPKTFLIIQAACNRGGCDGKFKDSGLDSSQWKPFGQQACQS